MPKVTIRVRENISIESPPEDLLDAIVKTNRFQNPKYVSNEKNGYSNWKIPETLETYRFEGANLIVPLGFGGQLLQLCKEHDLKVDFEDKRVICPVDFQKALKGVKLRPYQDRAVKAALGSVQGVIVSPTGSGKSLMGCEIIRRRNQKTLILVHRAELAKQWITGIKKNLGLTAGLIGDGQWDIGKEITVGLVQTLSSREQQANELAQNFGLLLIDECHHVPAETFLDVLGWFWTRYRYDLSATLGRADGLMPLIS